MSENSIGHNHGHEHHHHDVSGNITVAFFLNLAFAILEFVGGAFTNSMAIMSDAVHDLGDALVIGISLVLERKSARSADARHSYGFRRYSVLGALITTLILVAGAVAVVVAAVPRLLSPEPADYSGMIILAIFGVAVNGYAAWKTHGGLSLNQRAVSLHMLEDVLGWVAVLIGAVIMKFTGFAIIDPILSIAIACFIGYNAAQNIRKALPIFLEKAPSELDVEKVTHDLAEHIDGLDSTHHVHVWSLDEEVTIATLHAVAKEGYDPVKIKRAIKDRLAETGISHSTVEMEQLDEECPDGKHACKFSDNSCNLT